MTTISLLYNNIRGGRVFKSGKFVMTASALGFMMAVSAEAGSCLEQSTGSGNFTCSGAAVTTYSTQNLVTTASQIDVSVENGFGFSTVAQNGINISAGNKNISYLDNTGSSITAERNGLIFSTSDISLTNLSIPSFALGASCGGTTEISGNSTLSSVQGCEGEEEIRISDNSNIDTVEGAGGSDIIDVSGNSRIQVLSGGGDGQDMSSSLDDADVLSVAGNAFVDMITGDLGNDTITLSENASVNFTRGGVGNDSIDVSGSGYFSWISGDEVDLSETNGDDIIIVDADFSSLFGDSTDPLIGHDGGNDQITVNGSGPSSIVFGDGQNIGLGGRDTITINDGSFRDLDGDGGSVSQGGDDEIIINGGYVANISGDGQVTNIGGQDTITVNTGDVSIIAGDDKFSDYDYRPQYTDPDSDIITTKVYGNDEINVNGGNVYTIHGDAMRVLRTDGIADGDDTINVSGGYVSQIYGDTDHALAVGGHDSLNISGGMVDLALMMDGNDTINVTDGSIADVQMGNGDDAGSWSGGNLTSYSGGDGSDSLVISSAVDMSASTIDGGDDASSADGMIDTLTISGTSAQVNGNNITNWEVLGFDDGADVIISSLSIESINASCGGDTELTTGVVTGSVNGCVGDEGITISGDASVGLLEAAGGADTITLLDDAHVTSLNSGGDGQDGSDAQDAGDTLILASGTVDNDVMTELGNDTVNLSGTDIGGLLNTGSGADEVSMYDGSVNSIMTESGDDNVSLSGGSVDTDVLTGDGADSVVLNGIEMSGIVDTGADDDSVTMSDGRVAGIATDSGSDQVAISGGEAGPISTGTGQDKVLIYEGVVSNIDTGADEDAVIISGGSVSEIITADGADVASVSGGIIGTLNMGTDNDTVNLSGGSVSELISGQGDDSIAMTDGDVENLNSGEGEDVLVLAGGSLTDVTSGDGADIVVATGSVVDVINTGADEDAVLISGSTVYDLVSGDGDDRVNVAGISDVSSLESGSGNDEIALTGGVVKSVDAGSGDDALILSGSDVVNINMGAGNDGVTVNSGSAQVILTGSGDDSVSWNDGEVGTLSMGAGSDSLIVDNSNQSVSGVVLDGGDDMSTADGMIDRLTLRNGGAVDGSDLLNWELVELSGGDFTNAGPAINAGDNAMGTGLLIRDASFDLGDTATINGDLLLADTGLLIATGNGTGVYDVNGKFSAKGTVDMSDGQAEDVINVNGDYVLGGTIISDVNITDGNADMINISGNTVGLGPSVVDLNLIGSGDGEFRFDLIAVGGTTGISDFVLSDDISGGAYDYSLSLDDGTWSLGRDYLTQVAVYETIPSLIGATIKAETYHQRVGNRTWFSQSDAEGVWMKFYGENSSVTPDRSTEVSSYDLNSSSIQIGADKLLTETERGALIGGVVLSYDRASVETADMSADVDGYGVMGTLTYADINGAYVDAQLKVSNGSMDVHGVSGVDTSARMLSIEGGRKFDAGQGWTVTPQAQITFASVDFDDFTGQDGEVVSDEDGESTNLRVGASAQRGWENANGDFGTFYMTGNLHKTIDGYVSVDVSGSEIRMSNDGLSAEVGIGGSYTWDKGRSTIYGEVSGYKGISGSDLSGAKANVGLRIRF